MKMEAKYHRYSIARLL